MKPRILLMSAALMMTFAAAPAHAQFGSGSSYDTPRVTKAEKKAKKAEMKKLEEARAKKEAMERELKEKEQMAQSSYGSGSDQDSMKKKDDAMMKKDDAMMKKDDAMMKKDEKSYGSGTSEDAMMKKEDAMMKKDEMKKSYGSGDSMMKKEDAMMKKDEMNSYGSGTKMSKPINCPSGTTAQADGTCLITGNFLYN